MAEFIAIGEVVANKAGALGVRVENEDERKDFWREHHVDFALGSFDPNFSAIAISRPQDIASCKVGDRREYHSEGHRPLGRKTRVQDGRVPGPGTETIATVDRSRLSSNALAWFKCG